jgi:hypothetical protein
MDDLVIVFASGGPPPTVYCTAGTSTNGCVPAISASGNPDPTHTQPCVVDILGLEGQKSGIVFYGITAPAALPWCSSGSSSFLCVKAPTQRTAVQSTGGTAGSCNGSMTLNWNAFAIANPGALGQPWVTGSKAYVQGWYRDPPACKTTNLSDAVELTYR